MARRGRRDAEMGFCNLSCLPFPKHATAGLISILCVSASLRAIFHREAVCLPSAYGGTTHPPATALDTTPILQYSTIWLLQCCGASFASFACQSIKSLRVFLATCTLALLTCVAAAHPANI